MALARKIILKSTQGYRPELDALVQQFIAEGVKFVAVLGVDASRVEDIIDEICVGDGSEPYELLTSCHESETLDEVNRFSDSLSGEFAGEAQIIEF